MKRALMIFLSVAIFVGIGPVFAPPAAAKPPILEILEGKREVARERERMRRKILNADSPQEAKRAFRNGMRNIHEEKREARREVRKSVRTRFVGRVVAGVVLGEILRVQIVGKPPKPPQSDLCWVWSNSRRETGYWAYCSDN